MRGTDAVPLNLGDYKGMTFVPSSVAISVPPGWNPVWTTEPGKNNPAGKFGPHMHTSIDVATE